MAILYKSNKGELIRFGDREKSQLFSNRENNYWKLEFI